MKNCPTALLLVIVKLFNVILNSAVIPSEWTVGMIKPIYKKKGDINSVENYREITFLSCLGKLFPSLINYRLSDYLEQTGLLGEEQAGFRKYYNTLDHILTLQILTNYYISHNKQLFCLFMVYRKAFDLIDRTYLWTKLLKTNISGKMFKVIQSM